MLHQSKQSLTHLHTNNSFSIKSIFEMVHDKPLERQVSLQVEFPVSSELS